MAVAGIPAQQRLPVLVHDLRVELDLRALREPGGRQPEDPPHVGAGEVAEPHARREDDRRDDRAAVLPAEQADHVEPLEVGVRRRLVQLVLQGAGDVLQAVLPGQIHRNQEGAREVTDQTVDIGVQGAPVEQRHVQQESRCARPAADDDGEQRRVQRGGRDLGRARGGLEVLAALRIDRQGPPRRPELRACQRAARSLRQLGRHRQARGAAAPVPLVE